MNLILTMAGRYKRFRDEGFLIPKYFLPWGGKNVLSTILDNFNVKDNFNNVILITNKNDLKYESHIISYFHSINYRNFKIIKVNDTSGQSESAIIGIKKSIKEKYFKIDESILIHNIDTILKNRNYFDIKKKLNHIDGYIDIFYSKKNIYSFVSFDTDGNVKKIVEKKAISNNATSGLYGFKNSKIFIENYKTDSIFISEIYSEMIKNKKIIKCSKLYSKDETIVLGTPKEYFTNSIHKII